MSKGYSSKASQKLIYGSNSDDDKAKRNLECCFYSCGWAIGNAI